MILILASACQSEKNIFAVLILQSFETRYNDLRLTIQRQKGTLNGKIFPQKLHFYLNNDAQEEGKSTFFQNLVFPQGSI